jgi:hypothetical protein
MSDLGPAEMLDNYKNIACNADGGQVVVSVNKYRNANNAADQGGTADAVIVKDKLRYVAPDAWQRAGGSVAYVEAFMGKGSPSAIQGVLETFAAYSGSFINAYRKNPHSPEGKIAGILANEDISWTETLQQVCDACIGLDCNGFVGNWLKTVQPDFKLNQNSKPDVVRAKAQTYRANVSEIEYWDVMCYAKNEHIAAVHDTGHAAGRFQVVQSAGGGPRINEFAFIPGGRDTVAGQVRQKFRLGAPTKYDIGFDFYVISLW